MEYKVLLFYKYVTIENPEALQMWVENQAKALALTGRVIVAEEGINGTLEGTVENTEEFVQELLKDPRFFDVLVKRSRGTGTSFKKLSVKVRDEIVGTHFDKTMVNPRVKTAPHIKAEELKRWFKEKEDFVIIDMRNDYEFRSGHFKDSINPGLANSRDLPEAIPVLSPLRKKKVLTVCTGGIRCEKMSAYLLANGFENVYQLENGIHGYMEKYPGEDFLGTLYTFDGRITMDFGGTRTIVGKCHHCTSPTEMYVNCDNADCHLHFLVCAECKNKKGLFCSMTCRQTKEYIKS